MAPPRPSSPTSLLWAHQLKRENGHLLKRMQDLENSHQTHADRIKSAETAAKSIASGEITSLTQQVKTLQDKDSGLEKRVDAMEQTFTNKIDNVEADSEALTIQLASIQRADRVADVEREQTLQKDKALLRRIAEVEEGLRKYEKGLEAVGRKVNHEQVSLIKEQLVGLTKRVESEGSGMRLLEESLGKMQRVVGDLRKAVEGLETKAAEKRDSARPTTATQDDVEEEEDGAAPAPAPAASVKTKSHRWSGGGADRDIVQTGISQFGLPKALAAPKKEAAPARKARAPPKKPKKKGPVPKAPLTPGVRKSHKWGGGGADRDIVAIGESESLGRGKRQRSSDVSVPPPSKKAKQEVGGKAVVRSGRGWYEVVQSSSPEAEEDGSRKLPAQAEAGTQTTGAKRRSLFPTLRGDEADLIVEGGGTRQTRGQRQTQMAVKVEDEDEPKQKAVSDTGLGRRARAQVFSSSGNYGQVVGRSRKSDPGVSRPQPRRTIPQDD
ncbi:uncharacterized protein LTR77_003926 [Saxophila tyrrhenica]|uniref:Uncharacterized protein n=1 Tax=Saxophila tyrrhenica TaxID=1690608 RepID=A0AAV9PHQ1_9PEZI|nr:hypothetical protein LTR77_003926 [Saxophila tyrrhenica]